MYDVAGILNIYLSFPPFMVRTGADLGRVVFAFAPAIVFAFAPAVVFAVVVFAPAVVFAVVFAPAMVFAFVVAVVGILYYRTHIINVEKGFGRCVCSARGDIVTCYV